MFFSTSELKAQLNCGCDHVIAPGDLYIDGKVWDIQPGDVVCVMASTKKYLAFLNIHGAPGNPVTFINCGGRVEVQNTDWYYGIKFDNCTYFRFTGTGSPDYQYGFLVSGTPIQIPAVAIGKMSTDFEVDHIEVSGSGFSGIMAKTDPDCTDQPNRGNFVQRNTSIHDNYVHNTSAEGIYVGFPHYRGVPRLCDGVWVYKLPNELVGVRIYNNIVKNSGREGIQVGCAVSDVEIYNNTIDGFGKNDHKWQRSGVHLSTGTTGKFYRNIIANGTGAGMWLNAHGDNYIYNNIFHNVGSSGEDGMMIYDSIVVDGMGYYIMNNTFVNTGSYGYKVYTDRNTNLQIVNNIFTGAANYNSVSGSVVLKDNNNIWDPNPDNIQFENYGAADFHLAPTSPAVDVGQDVSGLGITVDYDNEIRPRGDAFDAGAFESSYENTPEGFFIHPNPIYTTAYISFFLSEDSREGSLKVYDTHGRVVALIAEGPFFEGIKYEYEFDSFFLAQGVYYYTLETEQDVKSIKIILVY